MGVFSKVFDAFVGANKTVDCKESQALNGGMYGTAVVGDGVGDNASIALLIKPDSDYTVVVTDVIAKLQDGTTTTGQLVIYEDPVYTGGTTEQTPRNFNRLVGDNCNAKVYNDAVYAPGGTAIFIDRLFGQRGGESENRFPAKLDSNKEYLAVFTNTSGSDADMVLRVVFGECA